MSFPFSCTKLVVVLALSLAGGCRATGGDGQAGQRRGEPLELERLQVGSVYGIGSRFESDDLEFVVDGFGAGLGNAEVSRAEEASAPNASKKAMPKTLRLSHATLRCRGRSSAHLEFDFVDNGGPVALEIAGKTRTAEDFIAFDGAQLGPARITVTETSTAGIRRGRVVVSGPVGKFAISGADLELADVRLSRGE